MVSTRILEPGLLLASQINSMPEKAEYRPAKFGYIETQFSRASTNMFPGIDLTIILSVMIF